MTRDEILSDLYTRLTSRTLWLTVLSIGFAYWSYSLGNLTAERFQEAVMGAVATYAGATAITGAAQAFAARPVVRPAPDAVVTTNVDTQAPPAAIATLRAPARRVRPSRAKPKPAGAKA